MDQWKIAVLGDSGVGKTALAVQFTMNCSYEPTIEEEEAYRKQLLVDNKMCFVEVIDTAGHEEDLTLRDQLIRESQGFILVYSIAARTSFDRVETFRQNMLRIKRGKPIFMLVGNKADKGYEREVSKEDGMALARTLGCEFLETSSKTAQNVDKVFQDLVRQLRMARPAEKPAARANIQTGARPGGRRRGCIIC